MPHRRTSSHPERWPQDPTPRRRPNGEPLTPTPLPPELAEFLGAQELAGVLHGSDRGTLLIVKAPATEIDSLRGTFPIGQRHELHDHPLAPLIRVVTSFPDVLSGPLVLESFVNVVDPEQRSNYGELLRQPDLVVLFYDDALRHWLSKRVPLSRSTGLEQVLVRADRLAVAIPPDRYDFDRAKADLLARTALYAVALGRRGEAATMEVIPLNHPDVLTRHDASTKLPPPPPSVTVNKAKDDLNRLVAQVRANKGSSVTITVRGKPRAVIISLERYRRHVAARWRRCVAETPPEGYPALIEALVEENARLLT